MKIQPRRGMKPKVPEHATHIIVDGECLFYDVKAPYEKSGMSIKGALEYDPKNDLVKCHECGEFFKGLGIHTLSRHGINAREYKIRHGLRLGSALVCESTRETFIAGGLRRFKGDPKRHLRLSRIGWRASLASRHWGRNRRTAESDNSRGMCNLQAIHRLQRARRQLGRPPTQTEMRDLGLPLRAIRLHFGSIKRFFKIAGIEGGEGRRWNNTALLACIKNFIETHEREPHQSDCRRGLIPNHNLYSTRFGGLRRAVALARKRKFRPGDLPTETRIRPVLASKLRARHLQRKSWWGVNIGRFALGGTEP